MLASNDETQNYPSGQPELYSAAQSAEKRQDLLLSPSIQRTKLDSTPAFELKLKITHTQAAEVEAWAGQKMERDAFCQPESRGFYQTTTLYLDTPQFDVFHRSPGYRRRKYRLRRYGEETVIYLERKSRQGDRVRKRRSAVSLAEISRLFTDEESPDWAGHWFREQVGLRSLQPACRISYCRTAFVALTSQGPARLTLDRQIQGMAANSWNLAPVSDGQHILREEVVCEFKFRHALPGMFKDLINTLQLQAGSVSKYRTMLLAMEMLNGGELRNARLA